ncbi:MAG: S4 domain-containing protein [Pseudomonadota bacterium]
MASSDIETLRLDVWLWRARFYKTRALSAEQISKRGVRISRHGAIRRTNKPGTTIAVGDIVTFGKSVHIRSVEVIALGQRRGPPAEAEELYVDWQTES